MSLHDYKRQVAALKQSISLKELMERDGHKMIRNGSLWKCCCPFHRERSPSCVIYPDNHAHCFGCHFHGDVFHYVMRRDGCDFKAAVERLSNGSVRTNRVTHKPVVKEEPGLPQSHLLELWDKWCWEMEDWRWEELSRGLGVSVESLVILAWNWAKEHSAWAIPMFNYMRHPVGFRFRAEDGSKWALKGSKQGLFIPAMDPQSDLYVVEGPTDCASMLSMGLFAIGKASAMQGSEEIIKFIVKNRIKRVIVIADNDTAGLNGAKKLIDVCPVPCCELVLPAKDAREFYRNGGTSEMIEAMQANVVWRNPARRNHA